MGEVKIRGSEVGTVDVKRALGERELVGGVAPRRETGGELATGVAIRRREKSGHAIAVGRASGGEEAGAQGDDAPKGVDTLAQTGVGHP